MALTKIKNISIDPDFRITGTEIADIFTLTSRTVTVSTPSANTEAANKAYVDNAIADVYSISTIAVSGQTNVVADSASATVTFVEDTGIIITTDANTDEITFKADATSNNQSNKLVIRDGSGNFSAGVITATSLTGKFTTARDIQLTGDVTGTVGFDGSQNVQLSTTIADSGVVDDTYGGATQVGQFVVDTRGIITSASNVNIEIPSTAITDWQEAVEDTYSASILAGTHDSITFTYDDSTGALSSTFKNPNKFDKFAVSGQTTVEADTETDTVTFAGSTGLDITTNAGTDTITFTNSGVTSAAVTGTGLSIDKSTGAVTISSNATSNNTNGTIVARDSSGNFSAGVITADLTGNVQGNVTGNVTSTGTSSFTNIEVTGGSINSAIIGGTTPSAITGTTITANTGFTGDLTGNVSGNVTSTGTSSFTNIEVTGGTIDGTAIGSQNPSSGDFTAVTTTGDLDVASGVLYVDTVNDMVGINNPTPTEALDIVGNAIVSGNATIGQDLTVTGSLTVLGSTTTVESTVTTLVDPVFTLGQGTYTSNDGQARGIEFKYYDGTTRTGFFGYDTTDGVYKLLKQATNNNEVFTGTKATLEANLNGKFTNARDIELIDDVTGTVSFDGSQNVQISTTISDTAVSAGSYGGIDKVATFTVNSQGRLTTAGEQQISVSSSAITDFDQAAQDAIGVLIDNGTQTDITVTYDSINHELNFSVPGAKSYSNFAVSAQDTVTANTANDTVTFAGSTGLEITTDSALETITFTNTGVTNAAVSGTGLSVDQSTGSVTIHSDATDANTFGTIVSRDGSGNFAAGTITADLTGNATSADKWSTSRTVTFTGDVTGNFNIDGSGDVSNVALTIEADSVALGTDTTGDYVEDVTAGTGITITNGTGEGSNPTITNDDKGSDQEIFKSIIVDGQTTVTADTNGEALTIVAGTGVTITTDNTDKTITFENTGLPAFKYVAVDGQDTVTADASDDTLTLIGGTAISISANPTTDAITFDNTGVTSFSTSGVGISVQASTGSVTLTSDATPNNDAGTIVSRDINGAFNAGDIGAGDISADSLSTVNGVTVGTLTSGRVVFAGASGLLSDDSDLTFNSTSNTLSTVNVSASDITTGGITVSDLTSGRLPFASTGGLLADSTNLTFNSGTNTFSTVNVSATAVTATSVTDSGLTSGRVTFAGTGGLLSDDSDFTYNSTSNTLSVANIVTTGDIEAANLKSTNLTNGRVTFAGTGGTLVDDADMTFDTATNTLSTVNVSANDVSTSTASVSSLTSGRVVLAGTAGAIVDDSVLTFSTGTLSSTNVTATATLQGADAKVTTLSATRLVFSDADHKLVDDADMTFDTATNTLSVTNVDSTQVVAGDLTLSGSTIESSGAGDLALDPGVGHFIDATTHKIINVVDPTADQHAATKKYVDDAVNTITNLNIAADTGTDTIDITVDTLTIAGTTNQVDTDAGSTADTVTISLSSTLVAPGSLEVTTTLDVTGTSTLADIDASTLDTTGAVTIGTTLDVTGLSTLADVDASTLDATGNVTVGGTLGVTGATTLSSTLDVTGKVTTTVGVDVGGDLDVTGDTTVTTITSSGAATFDSASVTADLQVGGSVTIDGNLTVTGTTTSLQTTNTQVTDNILTLNQGEVGAGVTAVTSGIEVDRGSLDTTQFVWTDTTDEWQLKIGTGYANLKLQDITVEGDATVNGVVTINNTVTFNDDITVNATVTVDDVIVNNNLEAGTLNVDNLTATRVVFAGANGQLVDDTDMTFDTATNTLSVTNVTSSGTVQGATVKATGLTTDRLVFSGTGGELVNHSDWTYSTSFNQVGGYQLVLSSTMESHGVIDKTLTAGRITFAGATQELKDDSAFTFNSGTGTLSVTNVSADDVSTASASVSDLTQGRVTFAGAAGLLSDSGDLTFNSGTSTLSVPNIDISTGISAPSITDSSLVAGRVTFAGTGGLLSDDSDLTYNSTTNTFTAVNVSATDVTTTSLTNSALTSGRVTFATTGGELTDSANLSFNTGTDTLSTINISASTAISSPSITDSGLTAGRITFAGTGGLLSDDSDLTYNSTTNTLSVPNASITNFSIGSLTQGRVVLVGADGALVDNASVTYNTTTSVLSAPNIDTTDINADGDVTIGGTLDVTGLSTLADVDASTLDTTGAVTIGSTLDVTGLSTLADVDASTLDTTGAVTIGDTLDVTGAVTMADTLDVTGAVTSTAGFTGDLTGDVTGTVSDISNHSIDDLGDVDLTGLQDQDTLRWDNATQQWVPSISGGFQMRRARFTANGTSPAFTLNNAPSGRDYLIVTVSGIPQAGDTFTVSGTTLTLGGTPQSGEIVEVLDFSTGVFSPAANSTDDIAEGSTNFYYTDTRVQTLMGNGTLSSDIIPASNNNYDLGSSSKAWKNIYLSSSGTMTFGSIKIVNNSGTLQFLNVADDSYALVDLGLTLDDDISIDGGSY